MTEHPYDQTVEYKLRKTIAEQAIEIIELEKRISTMDAELCSSRQHVFELEEELRVTR